MLTSNALSQAPSAYAGMVARRAVSQEAHSRNTRQPQLGHSQSEPCRVKLDRATSLVRPIPERALPGPSRNHPTWHEYAARCGKYVSTQTFLAKGQAPQRFQRESSGSSLTKEKIEEVPKRQPHLVCQDHAGVPAPRLPSKCLRYDTVFNTNWVVTSRSAAAEGA